MLPASAQGMVGQFHAVTHIITNEIRNVNKTFTWAISTRHNVNTVERFDGINLGEYKMDFGNPETVERIPVAEFETLKDMLLASDFLNEAEKAKAASMTLVEIKATVAAAIKTVGGISPSDFQ